MRGIPRRPLVLVAAFAAVAALGLGAGVVASSRRKPPSPPVIATVDLENVVKGLEKRKTKEAEFQAKQKEFKEGLEAKKKEIENGQKEFETSPDGPQKKLLGQDLIRKSYQFDFDTKYAEQFLDQMYGDMLRELYEDIATACKELAVRNSYSMVIADDSGALIRSRGKDDVTRAISLKRMLYVEPAHDVTQELIDIMNKQFAAGGFPKSQ